MEDERCRQQKQLKEDTAKAWRVSSDRENLEKSGNFELLWKVKDFIHETRQVRKNSFLHHLSRWCKKSHPSESFLWLTATNFKGYASGYSKESARTCSCEVQEQAHRRRSHLHNLCISPCSAWLDNMGLLSLICWHGRGLHNVFDFFGLAWSLDRLSFLMSTPYLLPYMIRLRFSRLSVHRCLRLQSYIQQRSGGLAKFSKEAYRLTPCRWRLCTICHSHNNSEVCIHSKFHQTCLYHYSFFLAPFVLCAAIVCDDGVNGKVKVWAFEQFQDRGTQRQEKQGTQPWTLFFARSWAHFS